MKPNLAAGWSAAHPLLEQVIHILQARHIEAYLVGGAVRDALLERQAGADLDFVVPGDGLAAARQVANTLGAAYYPLDPTRHTGRVVYQDPPTYLDFASYRGPTLQADLADRDFTINAMALSLADPPHLVDPLHGWQDLQAGRIRAASPTAFQNDPLRILRAVRQALELSFTIEPETERYLRQALPGLADVSAERQRDELIKLLNLSHPGQAVEQMHRLGILAPLLPEIEALAGVSQSPPHHLDVFHHTIAALEAWPPLLSKGLSGLPPALWARVEAYLAQEQGQNLAIRHLLPLALLWHDTGKPLTRRQEGGPPIRIHFLGHEQESATISHRALKQFRFNNRAIKFVETVIAHHMRPLLLAQAGTVSNRAIYRLFRASRGHGVALALHAWADHQATYPPGQGQAAGEALLRVLHKLIAAYFEQHDRLIAPPPLLNGHDLLSLGVPEGAIIGQLLNRLQEAQATGQVHTRAEAIELITTDPDFIKHRRSDHFQE